MEDYTFDSGEAGASETIPMEAGQIRKGGLIMIKGQPCKVAGQNIKNKETGEESWVDIKGIKHPYSNNEKFIIHKDLSNFLLNSIFIVPLDSALNIEFEIISKRVINYNIFKTAGYIGINTKQIRLGKENYKIGNTFKRLTISINQIIKRNNKIIIKKNNKIDFHSSISSIIESNQI